MHRITGLKKTYTFSIFNNRLRMLKHSKKILTRICHMWLSALSKASKWCNSFIHSGYFYSAYHSTTTPRRNSYDVRIFHQKDPTTSLNSKLTPHSDETIADYTTAVLNADCLLYLELCTRLEYFALDTTSSPRLFLHWLPVCEHCPLDLAVFIDEARANRYSDISPGHFPPDFPPGWKALYKLN